VAPKTIVPLCAWSLLLVGCSGASSERKGSSVVSDSVPAGAGSVNPADYFSSRLTAKEFETYAGPLHDREPAPAISSYRQNPVAALGSVFVRVARDGKTCKSKDAADFTYQRLLEPPLRSDCKSNIYPAGDLITKRVEGKATAELGYLIGSAAGDASYAFEFFISEPTSASFENPSKCTDSVSISAVELPTQTCEVRYIVGVVLTQITFRTYRKVEGKTENAFSVVKIGSSVYGNTTDIDNKFIITVDALNVSPFFVSEGGFLKRRPSGATPAEALRPFMGLKDEVLRAKLAPTKEAKAILLQSFDEAMRSPGMQLTHDPRMVPPGS